MSCKISFPHSWRWWRVSVRWVALAFLLVGLNWSAHERSDAATEALWEEVQANSQAGKAASGGAARAWRLKRAAWTAALRTAPREQTAALAESLCVVALPQPNGALTRFRLEETALFEPALAARFPQIKSYRGVGVDDPTAQVRLVWSPRGLQALALAADVAVSVAPVNAAMGDASELYLSRAGNEASLAAAGECLAEQLPAELAATFAVKSSTLAPPNFALGNVRRTFRIALATTVEYTNAPGLGGGTVEGALASVAGWLNAVNVIYERDLAVTFKLVADNDKLLFTANDNFTNGNPAAMLTEARSVIGQTLGAAHYDLGHVLGTGSGGASNIGVVCVDSGSPGPFKGGGVSLFDAQAPPGHPYYITRLAHEIAHQFGATHTFNDGDTNASCNASRNSVSAWEPGSGATLMSLAGACNPISSVRSFYFHGGTLSQMAAFLQSNAVCAARVNTGNSPPVPNAGADFRVPRNTPFALTATATDADVFDNANLTYAWEQVDSGSVLYTSPPFTDAQDDAGSTRPLFRSYAPTTTRTRVFPRLDYILNHANEPPLQQAENGALIFTGESLPKVARSLNFKVTVRDGRGGVADDDVLVDVDGTAGPFAVTAPNQAVVWPTGSRQVISWSVNNTNGATLNVQQVRLTLSTDGGQTFPVTLLAATPNDGQEVITVPGGLVSSTARVRVEAVGNIFFDVSDADFEITPGTPTCPTIASLNPVSGQAGVNVTLTGANFIGVSAVRFNNNLNANFTLLSDNQIRAVVPAGAVTGPIRLVRSDCADTQSANFTVAACNFTLNATTRNVGAAASNNNVAVTTGAACAWTATSPVDWVRITSAATATGNATVNFAISANAGPARSATLTVAGQAVTVNQTGGCTFRLSALAQNFGGGGGNAAITVATEAGCPWTAVSGVPWVKLESGQNYTGANAVRFTVEPNIGLERAGTLTIAGQTFNVTQDSNCGYAIAPAERSYGAGTGTGIINVSAGFDCTWVAQSHVNWLTIASGANGTGNFPVTFNVAANTGPPRTGQLTVAGRGFTVTQAGGCVFTLNRTNQDFGVNGGTGTVNVTAGAGCTWTATSPVDWVRVTNGASGTGNGTVSLTVSANTGAARVAVLTLAGQPYTISQAASSCAVTLAATTRTFTAAAATSTFNVTAAASCAWTATSNANWLTVTQGASATGNGTVGYSVAANPGGARTGTLTVGGVTHTVMQSAAACSYRFEPGAVNATADGQTATVNLVTANHCAWTAASQSGWLTLNGTLAGSGNGVLTYEIAPNAGPARSGTLTAGGQTLTVNQTGGCQFQLSTAQEFAAAVGESLSVGVQSFSGCGWQAESQASWIQLTSGAPGNGAGTVKLEVAPNPGLPRVGTVLIAGKVLTIQQAADVETAPLTLQALDPPYVNAGGADFTLTVSGLSFSPGAVVRWNGSVRPTTFINATKLSAAIAAADIANVASVTVTVYDPASESLSNPLVLLIAGAGANVSAASFATGEFAPEQMVALFGQRLATATVTATALPLPTTLGGTTVRVKDSQGVERPATLFFVSAGQINYLLPAGTANGPARVTVTNSAGQNTLATLPVNSVAPGLFSADASGRGLPAGVVLRVTGTQQRFEALSRFDTATRTYQPVPIDLGGANDQVFLILYGTGWRQRSNLNAVTCVIGGAALPVSFAGPQGALVGLDQLNIQLPRSLAGRGEVEITLTVDGKTANALKVQIK